jgi:surface antigen
MTLSEFIKKYLNKQVEYHSFNPAAKYQCTDLVNQYIDEVLGLTPVIGTNAKDFPSKVKTNEFEFVKNTPDLIPQKGWIAVWNGRVGSGAGHIAIVRDDKATVNQFNSIDQNWSKPLYTTLETHNYKNISGFLKPKGQNMSKMVQVEADKFEELVNKATKWDEVAKLGVDPKALIQDLKKCELAKSEMGDKIRDARERIETLEEDLKSEKASKAQIKGERDRLKDELAECEARPTSSEKSTEAKMFKLILYLSISGGIGYLVSKYVVQDPELFKVITPITNLILYYLEQQIKVLKADTGLIRTGK